MDNSTGAKYKTFLGLPMYSVDPCFMQCVMTLLSANPKEIGIAGMQTNIGDSSPTRARNTLTAQFLATDCDQILFIDSDILFRPEQLKRLCSHNELVVGGFYPKKQQGDPALVINTYEQGKQLPPRPDGLQKLRYVGAGCILIKRAVFEIMIAKMGDQIKFNPDETTPNNVQYAFWQETPYQYPDGHRRFLTEDWRFCQICMDLGIDVWGDTGVLVEHRGPVIFPLETQKAKLFGVQTPPVAPVSVLPVDSQGAAVVLPSSFSFPAEAIDDVREIMAGNYDIPQLKEPPKTVLDAGAHVGLFSFWASQKWPHSTIEAYEPTPESYSALTKNVGSRVKCINSALSNHNKEIVLRKGLNSLCNSKNERYAKGEAFTAPCSDAKDIGKYDFVKIDTEGSEIDIISVLDLSETKALVCESHCEDDRITLRQTMERIGFKCVHDEISLNDCRLLKFARPEALKE